MSANSIDTVDNHHGQVADPMDDPNQAEIFQHTAYRRRKRSNSSSNNDIENRTRFKDMFQEILDKSAHIGLNELYISGIEMGLFRDMALFKYGLQIHNIKTLSIIGAKLDESGMYSIKESLRNLIKLDLSNNCIGSQGTHYLAQGILKNDHLVSINLSSNKICGMAVDRNYIVGAIDLTGLKALLDSIETCPRLKYLDLSSNYLGGFQLGSSMNHPQYRGDDNNNDKQLRIELAYGYKVIQILTNFLQKNTNVVDLNLSTNMFEDRVDYVNLLLKYVGQNNICQSLCGRQNKISYPVIRTIYGVPIKNDPNIIPTFDFCGTTITPFCGRLLGHELSTLSTPMILNLSNNVMVSLMKVILLRVL